MFLQPLTRWAFLISGAFIVILQLPKTVHGQGVFPPLFNAALERPIATDPTDSTCGYPLRNAYCLSSTNGEFVDSGRCNLGYCIQACPGRTALPTGYRLLKANSPGFGCIVSDTVNVRPNSPVGSNSTAITRNESTCYLTSVWTPRLDTEGVSSFTIVAWVWLDTEEKGTLLQKLTRDNDVLFTLQIGTSGFALTYKSEGVLLTASIDTPIAFGEWAHIALQVHDVSVSVFVNGTGQDLAATSTKKLVRRIPDRDGTYRIGRSSDGSSQFLGRVQDLYIYAVAVSNREIEEIYSGQLPPVRVLSNCRCQSTYSRIKPKQNNYCIKNGVREETAVSTIRISRDAHPLEYINDGNSNSMWISRFQNEVEIEVDLGDDFQVFYVVIQFYSPLPKAVTILRQKVDSSEFTVWQYYADDCSRFGLPNNGAYEKADSVNCLQFATNGAQVPYSLGNITFNLLAPGPVARPGSSDFYNTPDLHEFVRARRVKLRFQEHYYVKNIRHQYYAVFEYIVTAWCDCNGHTSVCDSSSLPYKCKCLESSNTEGTRCNKCKALFNDKQFRKGDNKNAYPCKECQCYGHASSCIYDASVDPFPDSHDLGGGGVCINCQDFTTGVKCNTCQDEYFRPAGVSLYDKNVCQSCDCNLAGVVDSQKSCEKEGGQCTCKSNVEGRRCNTCKAGFFNLQSDNSDGCQPCFCNELGVENGDVACNETSGQCNCKANVRGLQCDECAYGYFNLAEDNALGCSPCNCNPFGSTSVYCDPSSGQCQCKARVEGMKCNECKDNFFNFTSGCVACNCNDEGTELNTVCNKKSGQCFCKRNVKGINCNSCKNGTYDFGASAEFGCADCPCFRDGTINGTGLCNATSGDCFCKENVEGQGCDRCKPSTWGLNGTDPLGCQPCNCDITGTLVDTQAICDQNTGQCSCLSNRQGRQCDACAKGFYINPDGGCLACSCHIRGTLQDTFCDTVTGQCECKTGDFGVAGKRCDDCLPMFYKFNPRVGKCTPCNCLKAGSLGDICDTKTGQCPCKPLVQDLQCKTCKPGSSHLEANNTYGCSTAPFQQPPPQVNETTSVSLFLLWKPPDSPNGVIAYYLIFRNDTLIYNKSANIQHYRDLNLAPYSYNSYVVEAVNIAGFAKSTPVVFQTLAGKPSSDMVLTVEDIRAKSVICTWTAPVDMNGPLLKYVIISIKNAETESKEEWEGQDTLTTLTDLTPYSRYTLRVRACTIGGCSDSEGKSFLTQSAPPANQKPPTITNINSTALKVSWNPPDAPNGIISFYELWFRGPQDKNGKHDPEASRIFHPSGRYDPLNPSNGPLSPPATTHTVARLEPYTTYEFQVFSENDAGKVSSEWSKHTTEEALPILVRPPFVRGISSLELRVTWSTPLAEETRGIIIRYRLYQYIKRDLSEDPFGPPYSWESIYEGIGLGQSVSGLTPYSEHSFILEACNSKGCVNSTAATGRTLLAAPEGVQRPDADGFNSTVMEIKWEEPIFPNGPTTKYTVEKTNIALSYPASVIRGTRFTGGGYYFFNSTVIPQNVAFTGIRFKFRLERGTGLLLFSGSSTQEEFIAVQFVKGRPRFLFDTQGNCGAIAALDFDSYLNWTDLVNSGFHTLTIRRLGNFGTMVVNKYFKGCRITASITTTDDEGLVYNDKKWHTFEARRTGISGTVKVDDLWEGQGFIRDTTCRDTSIIGPTTGVYVGGFPADFILRRTDQARKVETSSLQGCIEKVEILQQIYPYEVWQTLDWTQARTNDLAFLNWQGCPINLQSGFHFMGKGFLVLTNCNEKGICHVKGNRITVKFKMRTALHSGFLFLIHGGTGHYIYAVLENGSLRFVISKGDSRTVVVYDDPDVNFCDGTWRVIKFVKTGQQAMISVTNLKTFSLGDPNVAMPLDLTSPVYLGGFKPLSEGETFMKDNGLLIPDEGFGGCIAAFEINRKLYEKDLQIEDVANTNLDGCPPYHLPEQTCRSSLISKVYEGTGTVAYETGLLPYTDYIYRVKAENEGGSTPGPWGYGRTREGAPSGVKGPYAVHAVNGNEIEVKWVEPELTYGLLSKYIIMAYANDSEDATFDVDDVRVSSINMTGVTPNTNYLVKIKACTSGGCTESEDGLEVLTPIEAPEEVPAPTADTGPTYLFVKWAGPGKPNGPRTGYFLYQNGKEIYNGGENYFNATGLSVYTVYQFYIAACTSSGCTNGPIVSISTDQLPPTTVGKPTLTVLDTTTIDTKWERPTKLNGVLESYFLLASKVEGERGEVVYNTTDLRPDHIIRDLTAGTKYYITVGACTGGGCTTGEPASATTEESAPAGVPQPIVTSPSPTQLEVKWDPPQNPNGEITSYNLFQNGVNVYTGLDRTFSASGLGPYSRHLFYVQACTVEGCSRSEEVEVRTQQAQPEGIVVLQAQVVDARKVNVSWTMPEKPNGETVFQVFFSGLFYEDIESWNYTTVQSKEMLLEKSIAYTVYQVGSLVPLSTYSIQVKSTNEVGHILSNVVTVNMPPGTPDGMAPPDLLSESSTSIKVNWKSVGRVNAEEEPSYLLQFQEVTPGALVEDVFGRTVTLSYTKGSLKPFTEYSFRVVAINSFGSTQSPWVSTVTRQDKPDFMSVPMVVGVKSRYMDITWSAPIIPNGVITHYNIYQNGKIHTKAEGNETSDRMDNLQPFTYYTFELEACTLGGCTRSSPSSTIRSLQDLPQEVLKPQLIARSPSAIEIKWEEPGKPNGPITHYFIQRMEGEAGNVTDVTTVSVGNDLVMSFIDESSDLSPFTQYSYRVNPQNGAGIKEGPWALIRTGASRPAGVKAPTVTSISPSSVTVEWEEPVQINGELEYYEIRFPVPIVEVKNTSMNSVLVDNLTPYTTYSITMTACLKSGGCSESSATDFTTEPTFPAGQKPPIPTAVSQAIISVSWESPTLPNGFGIKYELSRKKIRQPLNPNVDDVGEWQSLYIDADTFYEDRKLPMFTTYVYRITVFNNIGHMISDESVETTTFGGLPRLPAEVTVEAVDHQAVRVNWTLPSPVELQGEVQSLLLDLRSKSQNSSSKPSPTATSVVVNSLLPNMEYSVELTVIIFGGASITSDPVSVITKDGAPEDFDPPVLSALSTTALRVSWNVPAKPNGKITSYSILLNGKRIETGVVIPGSMVIRELEPYTVYDVRMEACTVYACVESISAFGTTAEASPQNMAAPVIQSQSATAVNISWKAPQRENGVILRYDLWKKTLKICSEIPKPTPDPETEKCTYIQCGILENICGSICYSGSKVCCDGVIHDAKPNYACCDQHYIFQESTDMECCAGKFFKKLDNYICCGNKYVEVPVGHVCCPDVTEDRVSISLGDACCGSLPFDSSGAQKCCKGNLMNGFDQQCCGGEIVSDTTVCCGDSSTGSVFLPRQGYTCCGKDYVEEAKTLCCTTDTGHSKVHFYNSADEKVVSAHSCCGLNAITSSLSCCNYVGYDSNTHVCADKSDSGSGCGTGTTCPLSQASALCDKCDFDPTKHICGFVPDGSNQDMNTTSDSSNGYCTTETDRVYSGRSLIFEDTAVTPYSQYEYYVVAVNSAGTATSKSSAFTTLEAVPQGLHPPTTRVAPGQLFAIYISWTEPDEPNGVLTKFTLERDGIEVYSGLDMNFTDDFNILPYRSYSYIVSVCNAIGCSSSDPVIVATAQAIPEELLPPIVETINSTAIKFKGQTPGKPNGVITVYSLTLMELSQEFNSSIPQQFIRSGLTPYTEYTVQMVVCTVIGCASSSSVAVRTAENVPQGLNPPRVIVISSTTLELYWQDPVAANGQLKEFIVIQTNPAPVTQVYVGFNKMVRLDDLFPGQTYTYQLEVSNGAGKLRSRPVEIIMPLITPLNIPPVKLVKMPSSTSIKVKWDKVVTDLGEIDQYRVLLNVGKETERISGAGLETQVTISDLHPSTEYSVRLQACLRNVLNGCGTSSAILITTKEAKPQGMAAPILSAMSFNAVRIMWKSPTNPNGVITAYRIYQRNTESGSPILVNQVNGEVFEFVHSGNDLNPFSEYSYKVLAQNSVGDTESDWSLIRTKEAPPEGLSNPEIESVSSYGLSLSWSAPMKPNGRILQYTIFYNKDPPNDPNENSVSVSGLVTNTSIAGLEAFTNYYFYVEAINSAGSVKTGLVYTTTKEGFPSGLPEIKVEKIKSGTAVILKWDNPVKPNGVISMYKLYETGVAFAIYTGLNREFEYRRLSPFTEYSVKLEACTKVGCTLGPMQSFKTAEIAPSAQPSPALGSINATHVTLRWRPPVNPNGEIVSYEILRLTNPLRKRRSVDVVSFNMVDNYQDQFSDLQNISVPLLSEQCIPGTMNTACFEIVMMSKINSIEKNDSSLNNDQSYSGKGIKLHRIKRDASDPDVVYKTTDTDKDLYEFTDSGLQPHTSYQYSIQTTNGQGSTNSPWQTVTTEQAAPSGVLPPKLSHIPDDIHSILITWSPPKQINGILQSYQIQRNDSVPYSFLPDLPREFKDSGLAAFTLYSYTLMACTGGGCTTSELATILTTESSPLRVDPPIISALDSNRIQASWTKPLITNGEIIDYKLKVDGSIVYSGLSESFLVKDLTPYSKHVFVLVACTNGGCTESGEVTGTTTDAPPTGLSRPLLRVLSARSIEVTWSPPSSPNGVISSYDVRRGGRLIYTNNIAVSGNLATSYADYSLEPGEEYTYTIVARNRKGSVESKPSAALTYSDSPSGLAPPLLTALSSTSIRANWKPPSNPNGLIRNYTLFLGTKVVYSGASSTLAYTVPGLEFFTEYSIQIQACTSIGCETSQSSKIRTQTAQPEGQSSPTLIVLADEKGAHHGVQASWGPPAKPNGNILYYELLRRSVSRLDSGNVYGDPIMIYNGSNTLYRDTDSSLLPYSRYEYLTAVVNDVGRTGSQWASVQTKEDAPSDVPPLKILTTTSTTITVEAKPPLTPNGQVKMYKVVANDTVQSSSPYLKQTIGLTSPLLPFTTYVLKAQACTAVACGESEGIATKTESAKPTGLSAIEISQVTNTSAGLKWKPPQHPNGIITKYEVYMKTACPKIFQPFDQSCITGDAETIFDGIDMAYDYESLRPYKAYEFKVQAFNNKGGVDFLEWVRAETNSADPKYVSIPSLAKNRSLAVISWSNTFQLNGRLREFILLANGKVVFRGIDFKHSVERKNSDQVINFIVQVVTFYGQAETPVIVFDPNAVGNVGTTPPPPPTTSPMSAASSSNEVYEEIWFIIVMCILALLILFVIIFLCLRKTSSKEPYIRERMPLPSQHPRTMKRDLYIIDSRDGSILDGNNMDEFEEQVYHHDDDSGSELDNESVNLWSSFDAGSSSDLSGVAESEVNIPGPSRTVRSKSRHGRGSAQQNDRDVFNVPVLPTFSGKQGVLGLARQDLRGMDNFYQGPGFGMINPAFSQDGELSRVSSEKMSRLSIGKFPDDSDLHWDRHFDSGLFDSLDDEDDDDDSRSGQTYSYTKEQTVFTDTHL